MFSTSPITNCEEPPAGSEDDVVLFAIEVTETGYGVGLSSVVQAAVPNVVGAVIAEISRRPFG